MIQNSCKVIGLTGGIATGKSTVTNILLENGFKVIDADKIAREVVEIGKPAYNEIVQVFGDDIVDLNGNIDRAKLGKLVFDNDNVRMILNKIVHPRIFDEIKKRIEMLSKGNKVIFVDVPLLIEELDSSKRYGLEYDEIWLVYVAQDTQIERLIKRDNISYEDAYKRVIAQMPIELKKNFVDIVIENNEGIKDLRNKVKKLINSL
jgi:dephospho-CoA kinase